MAGLQDCHGKYCSFSAASACFLILIFLFLTESLSLHKSRMLQTHGNKSAFHRLDIDSGPVEKKRVSPQLNGGDHRLHMVDAAENTRSPKVCIAAGLNAKMKIDC